MIVKIDSRPKRMMAIDPGEKRIGVAISDASGIFTKPLMVINHISREKDVEKIMQICREYHVSNIVVGFTQNEDGSIPLSGRRAIRLADALRSKNKLIVHLWDEFETTTEAKKVLIKINKPSKLRRGHHDDVAAAILLQSYIENNFDNKL